MDSTEHFETDSLVDLNVSVRDTDVSVSAVLSRSISCYASSLWTL